jgi:two-component system, cell cycle sensor histidine kinase and response regulator CckA
MATTKKKESSTILLIDDDPLIRDLSSEYLESNGLSVITAANGLEGLKLYQDHCEEISLVVLDLVMPKMSGRDCWLRLREIDPQVRVLVTTGSSLNKELRICLKEGVLGYLTKPFRPSQLLDCLRGNL